MKFSLRDIPTPLIERIAKVENMNNHSDDDIFYRSPSFWDFKRLISISVLYPEWLMESCKMVLTFDSVAEIP